MAVKTPHDYKKAIRAWRRDIYEPIPIGDTNLWIPTPHLEALLNKGLKGLKLAGLPLRTRSKVVKTAVCQALGYPVPKSFKKTRPRFPGQQLDTYTQKRNNLQVWNEELSPTRRYAIIQVSENGVVIKVKVVDGQMLATLDTTGTITKKYQARLELGDTKRELVSASDTQSIQPFVKGGVKFSTLISSVDEPTAGMLLPITEIFERLSTLVGRTFDDPGTDQERNRGAALHKLVCKALGYSRHEDNGQFPDVRHQLLEVKLQTSPTIDLGLVLPNSTDALDMRKLVNHLPRQCDTRYALFYARTDGKSVKLTHLFVSTGADFFTRFRRFEGKVINKKLQIPLPKDFFDR
jgi:hypothetical protein